MALSIGGEIRQKRAGSRSHWDEQFTRTDRPTMGSGRSIEKATVVQSATQRSHLNQFEGIDIPNMVEMQLESYQWFLNVGLRELFDSFSPIEDFTGTMSLEFLDYTLGEPKFSPDECRERDLTYEMPMKVKVRVVNKETGELKESEVYLGELPCMTERGTFIINGAERVVVAQLSRSPGAYFKEEISYSGRRLLQMQIIPQEGAWVDAEVAEETTKDIVGFARRENRPVEADADHHAAARFFGAWTWRSRTPRAPNRWRSTIPKARSAASWPSSSSITTPANSWPKPGNVIDDELFERIKTLRDNPDDRSRAQRLQCATTRQILELFGEKRTIDAKSRAESLTRAQRASGNDREYNYFLAQRLGRRRSQKVVCARVRAHRFGRHRKDPARQLRNNLRSIAARR